jgi:hypothetical protein
MAIPRPDIPYAGFSGHARQPPQTRSRLLSTGEKKSASGQPIDDFGPVDPTKHRNIVIMNSETGKAVIEIRRRLSGSLSIIQSDSGKEIIDIELETGRSISPPDDAASVKSDLSDENVEDVNMVVYV